MEAIIAHARKMQIADQWRKMEDIEKHRDELIEEYYRMVEKHSEMCLQIADAPAAAFPSLAGPYTRIINDLTAVKLSLTCVFEELAAAQDRYNELVLQSELNGNADAAEMDGNVEDEDMADGDDLHEIVVVVKERKTRRDVMGTMEAVKSHKATKNHKLKQRTVKRDRTKTVDGKRKSLRYKQ